MGPFEHGDGYDEICGIENHTQSAFGAHNFTITWGLLLGTQHIPQILAWIHRCEADGCCHALGWWPTLPQLVTIRVSQKAKKLEVWISCTMNIAENRHILNDDILITNFLLVTSHKKRNYCFFLGIRMYINTIQNQIFKELKLLQLHRFRVSWSLKLANIRRSQWLNHPFIAMGKSRKKNMGFPWDFHGISIW